MKYLILLLFLIACKHPDVVPVEKYEVNYYSGVKDTFDDVYVKGDHIRAWKGETKFFIPIDSVNFINSLHLFEPYK